MQLRIVTLTITRFLVTIAHLPLGSSMRRAEGNLQSIQNDQSIRILAKTANFIVSMANVNTTVAMISSEMSVRGSGLINTPPAARQATRMMSQADATNIIGAGRECHN